MDYRIREQRRRSFDVPGHAHELTFTCYRRFPFLSAERTCLWLAEAVERARRRLGFEVWAYVLMPEHTHLIVRPRLPAARVSAILKAIKQPVGQQAIAYLEQCAPQWISKVSRTRGGRVERLFWQSGGGYDRNLTESRSLLAAVDYLHQNPVRRGLVSRSEDWRWSSAGWFLGQSPNTLPPEPIPWEWTLGKDHCSGQWG